MKGKEEGLLLSIKRSSILPQLAELLSIYIEKERDVLENAVESEINFTQGSIKAYRKLLRKVTEPVDGR